MRKSTVYRFFSFFIVTFILGIFPLVTSVSSNAYANVMNNVNTQQALLTEDDTTEKTEPISLEITALNTPLVEDNTDVVISARITNMTEEPIHFTNSRISLQNTNESAREHALSFLEFNNSELTEIYTDSNTITVEPKKTHDFSLTIPRSSIEWNKKKWGVRGLELDMSNDDTSARITDRTLLIMNPGEIRQTPTSIAVIINASTDDYTKQEYSYKANSNVDIQRITTLLKALEKTAASVVIEPEFAHLLNTDVYSSLSSTQTEDNMQEKTNSTASISPTVLLTPQYDADIDALYDTKKDLVTQFVDKAKTTAEELKKTSISALTNTFVAPPFISQSTVDHAQSLGYTRLITSSEAYYPKKTLSYTPSAHTHISTSNGNIDTLVSDSIASSALSGFLRHVSPHNNSLYSSLSSLNSQQLTLALSALTYLERPNDERPQLLTYERAGLSYNSDTLISADTLRNNITALFQAPWIKAQNIDDLFSTQSNTLTYTPLPQKNNSTLTQDHITTVLNSISTCQNVDSLKEVAQSAYTSTKDFGFRNFSLSWNGHQEKLVTSLEDFSTYTSARAKAISIADSSDINVIAKDTDIPVHIRNDLPVDVSISAVTESWNAHIKIKNNPTATLPASSTSIVRIPISAKGSGNVSIDVNLHTSDGITITQPHTLHIRVRAEWESRATFVIIGLLIFVFVFGLIQSIRRKFSRK
ncbi:MAG: hypothetical protein J6M18_03720 [Actinomycetaceae bacterium]|nr:hypothetical protein [Actinomycetaceae bacterium]